MKMTKRNLLTVAALLAGWNAATSSHGDALVDFNMPGDLDASFTHDLTLVTEADEPEPLARGWIANPSISLVAVSSSTELSARASSCFRRAGESRNRESDTISSSGQMACRKPDGQATGSERVSWTTACASGIKNHRPNTTDQTGRRSSDGRAADS